MDFYSEEHLSKNYLNIIRKKFEEKYPILKNKKIILYAPTFRETLKYNNFLEFFDIKKFNEELGEDYVLIIRLHPKINEFFNESSILFDSLISDNVINCTDYENEQDLLLLSDILITDYSSIMIEFSFLKKPSIFFAYDLERYLKEERGFYYNYKNVPGPIVYNTNELIKIIKGLNFDYNKIEDFINYQFDFSDSNSSKRIVDFLLKD